MPTYLGRGQADTLETQEMMVMGVSSEARCTNRGQLKTWESRLGEQVPLQPCTIKVWPLGCAVGKVEMKSWAQVGSLEVSPHLPESYRTLVSSLFSLSTS